MKVLNSPCIHVHYFIDLWHNTSLTVDNYVGKHCSYLINNNLTICMYCILYKLHCKMYEPCKTSFLSQVLQNIQLSFSPSVPYMVAERYYIVLIIPEYYRWFEVEFEGGAVGYTYTVHIVGKCEAFIGHLGKSLQQGMRHYVYIYLHSCSCHLSNV